ncbi:DUF4435 domain-containing protein [Paramylibacter ulvae]|uniref:DUF4435 domain-containing protein n=1 Tax=Paramylibacter ulvae TaxID=1651968 RepID=UPI0016796EF7|nr:DUF4435 domain-containing protein [Amylibacter ulvae]
MSETKAYPSIDEIVSLLGKSNLPTVLVEGADDIIFYRKLEEELNDLKVDVLAAGDKDSVLEIRNRIAKNPTQTQIAFVVDKDLWVHDGVPKEYMSGDLVTTDGYSIENDLFRDGDLESFLDGLEAKAFHSDLQTFVKWYALTLVRFFKDQSIPFRTHPSKILDDQIFLNEQLQLIEGEEYPEDFFNELLKTYSRTLRGKSLFAVLQRQLSRQQRDVKFSSKQLMVVAANRKGEHYSRIAQLLRKCFE